MSMEHNYRWPESLTTATPDDLVKSSYALMHADYYDAYVELRLHGIHSVRAMQQCFPPQLWQRDIAEAWRNRMAVEFNPYTVQKLRDAIASTPVSKLWNPKLAIHHLLSLAQDIEAKDSSRLGAMKELNVMCNITVVDENGKTKAGRSLADFYRAVEQEIEAQNQPETEE
jgi:hypothetical protein